MSRNDGLSHVLSKLQVNRDGIPWAERRSLAATLDRSLARADERESAIRLIHVLVDDPKWEVRKEIASIQPSVPDDELAPLAAKLTQDTNSFVRNAAERALGLSGRATHGVGSRRKGLDDVLAQFDLLRAVQGRTVGTQVHALALRLYEVTARATVHDLRGVLTSALSNLKKVQSIVAESPLDAKGLRDGLKRIADRVNYLHQCIEAMRTYAQAIAHDRAMTLLKETIADAHAIALDGAASRYPRVSDVKTKVSVDEKILVNVTKHQVVSASANMLKNAYEAVLLRSEDCKTGQVDVSACSVESGEIHIIVRDNGVGIKNEDLRVLWAFLPGHTTKKDRVQASVCPRLTNTLRLTEGPSRSKAARTKGQPSLSHFPLRCRRSRRNDSKGSRGR